MHRLIAINIVCCLLSGFAQAQLPVLTKKEVKQGRKLLFDGQTSTGWKSLTRVTFPEKGWINLPGTDLGCEFQILDDDNHPNAKQGRDGNRTQNIKIKEF